MFSHSNFPLIRIPATAGNVVINVSPTMHHFFRVLDVAVNLDTDASVVDRYILNSLYDDSGATKIMDLACGAAVSANKIGNLSAWWHGYYSTTTMGEAGGDVNNYYAIVDLTIHNKESFRVSATIS